MAVSAEGVSAGFPISIEGMASKPAFDAAGRILVTVVGKENGPARALVFDASGNVAVGGSGNLGVGATDLCVGIEGSWRSLAAPLVGPDGTRYVISAHHDGDDRGRRGSDGRDAGWLAVSVEYRIPGNGLPASWRHRLGTTASRSGCRPSRRAVPARRSDRPGGQGWQHRRSRSRWSGAGWLAGRTQATGRGVLVGRHRPGRNGLRPRYPAGGGATCPRQASSPSLPTAPCCTRRRSSTRDHTRRYSDALLLLTTRVRQRPVPARRRLCACLKFGADPDVVADLTTGFAFLGRRSVGDFT